MGGMYGTAIYNTEVSISYRKAGYHITHDAGLQTGSTVQFQHAWFKYSVPACTLCLTSKVMHNWGHAETVTQEDANFQRSFQCDDHTPPVVPEVQMLYKRFMAGSGTLVPQQHRQKVGGSTRWVFINVFIFSGEHFEQTVNKQVKGKQTKTKQVVAVLIS